MEATATVLELVPSTEMSDVETTKGAKLRDCVLNQASLVEASALPSALPPTGVKIEAGSSFTSAVTLLTVFLADFRVEALVSFTSTSAEEEEEEAGPPDISKRAHVRDTDCSPSFFLR
jgi:hypothetical protein